MFYLRGLLEALVIAVLVYSLIIGASMLLVALRYI